MKKDLFYPCPKCKARNKANPKTPKIVCCACGRSYRLIDSHAFKEKTQA